MFPVLVNGDCDCDCDCDCGCCRRCEMSRETPRGNNDNAVDFRLEYQLLYHKDSRLLANVLICAPNVAIYITVEASSVTQNISIMTYSIIKIFSVNLSQSYNNPSWVDQPVICATN